MNCAIYTYSWVSSDGVSFGPDAVREYNEQFLDCLGLALTDVAYGPAFPCAALRADIAGLRDALATRYVGEFSFDLAPGGPGRRFSGCFGALFSAAQAESAIAAGSGRDWIFQGCAPFVPLPAPPRP